MITSTPRFRPALHTRASYGGGDDIVLGLTGASLDEISKTKSSVGIYTQSMGVDFIQTVGVLANM